MPVATVPAAAASSASPVVASAPPARNVAVDAYRGLVMLLMMGEVLQFWRIARAYPASTFWHILAWNQTHVEWAGMSLHDTIQPGFTFLVGVSLPYSIRSRQRKGQSFRRMLLHTIWRSVLLIALGIFLRSDGRPITYFTFEDTLTQIGLGYTFGFLLTFARPRWQWIATGAILFGYWLAWALYPAPGPELQLGRGRRAAGLASAPLHRFRRALEQELESGPGLRRLVPEPVSAHQPVPLQRRRLPDAELYPNAGNACCWA